MVGYYGFYSMEAIQSLFLVGRSLLVHHLAFAHFPEFTYGIYAIWKPHWNIECSSQWLNLFPLKCVDVWKFAYWDSKVTTFHKSKEWYNKLPFQWQKAMQKDLVFFLLLLSMSRSFQKNFVLETGPVSGGAWRLLCSWDFSVVP